MTNKQLQIYLKLFPPPKLKSQNQGFVLPMVVGLGLIMTLVGLTMIGRSSDDQITAISQTQSSQALIASETGVTQLMQFLNSVRVLAEQDLGQWETEYERTAAACQDSSEALTDYTNSNWININNERDRFRVLDYQYTQDEDDPNLLGTGVLSIEAQANFNQNAAKSAVDVTIPVKSDADGVPGLYVKSADLSNNQVDGDLLLHDCELTGIDTNNVSGEARAYPFAEFPPLPELPAEDNYQVIDSISAGSIGEDNNLTFPLDENDPYTTDEDGNKTYHYLIEASGGRSINLSGGNRTIRIEPGKKVTFYLQGDVELSGNAGMEHICDGVADCKPTNFQVFGGDGANDTYANGITERFCLSGSSSVDGFIFAPKANVAVDGGGSGTGITGTVWADSWNQGCGSNTSKTLVTQNATWDDLPFPAPKKIAPSSKWERKIVGGS